MPQEDRMPGILPKLGVNRVGLDQLGVREGKARSLGGGGGALPL